MFQMPAINTQFQGVSTAGGDLFGMFNNTPQSVSLMKWLVSPQAQEIWVKRGGFIASNKNVPIESYPDEPSKQAAQIFTSAQGLKYDASDQMPGAMNDAFFKAVVSFAQDQSKLDSILTSLDSTQKDAYSS